MRSHQNMTRFKYSVVLCIAAAILLAAPAGLGQNAPNNDRVRAFQLLHDGNFPDAQALLEKLAVANSSDGDVQFGLAFAILATSKNIKDEDARRRERVRARNLLLRAKQLGVSETYDDLMESSLASIPTDGSETTKFSSNAEAEKAMQEGEAAFARQDYDKAITAYQRALTLDPKLYYAALFLGDMYFQKNQIEKAGEWYGRAIAIDPDKETAYRYWSDVLLKNGRSEEARTQAIEAIVAEPYNRTAYNGLVQWARAANIAPRHPQIDQPQSSMIYSEDKNKQNTTTITIDPEALDPQHGPKYYWAFYDLTRITYRRDKFKTDFPTQTSYRHSLKEEASALRVVAETVAADLKSGKLKSVDDASLANLLKVHQADLIEAYVLFARPDDGIAQDYEAYRKMNRVKLRRYWAQMVLGN
jgi:tetratricopeptide (TPR) repeat protein